MKTTRLAPVLVSLSLPFFVGCMATSEPGESTGNDSQELVSPNQPIYSPNSSIALPDSLPDTSGTIKLVGKTGGTATGYYSNGFDTQGAANTNGASWVSQVVGNTPSLAAPQTSTLLQGTVTASLADLAANPPTANPFGPLTDLLGPLATVTSTPSQVSFRGFPALRSRSLRKNTMNLFGTLLTQQYNDPSEMGEFRQRGARLYCAMREAAKTQAQAGQKTMGKLSAFSLNLFKDAKIDFLRIEPTTALSSVEPPTTPNDGTQSFHIPMQFGSIVTPISVLPSLAEARYPVSLTTVDSEVLTKSAARYGGLGVNTYDKEHQTLMHADAVSSSRIGFTFKSKIPLFTIGPVIFSTTLGLTVSSGEVSVGIDKLLANPPTGYLYNSRNGIFGMNQAIGYHDGAWYLPEITRANQYQVLPNGDTDPFWRVTPDTLGPMKTRVDQNDDHHLTGLSTYVIDAGIEGKLDVPSFGALNVSLVASGKISGTVSQRHEVRDAVYAENYNTQNARMLAAEGLVVRPRTVADVNLTPLVGSLKFDINLGFTHPEWTVQLINSGTIPLAHYDSDTNHAWGESNAFRVGTGSENATPGSTITQQPMVHSHLAGSADYFSFPTTVAQCLATQGKIDPPKACKGTQSVQPLPAKNLCLWSNWGQLERPAPTNVCQNKVRTLGSTLNPLYACEKAYLDFLCAPQTHEQYFSYEQKTVVRVVPTDAVQAKETLIQWAGVVKQCGLDAQAAGFSKSTIENYFVNMFHLSACQPDGTLILAEDIITTGQDPYSAPAASSPSTCQ